MFYYKINFQIFIQFSDFYSIFYFSPILSDALMSKMSQNDKVVNFLYFQIWICQLDQLHLFKAKVKCIFFHRCILHSTKCLTNLPLEQFHFKGLLWQQNRALGLSKGVNWWLLQTKNIVWFYILANVFIFMLLIKFNSL